MPTPETEPQRTAEQLQYPDDIIPTHLVPFNVLRAILGRSDDYFISGIIHGQAEPSVSVRLGGRSRNLVPWATLETFAGFLPIHPDSPVKKIDFSRLPDGPAADREKHLYARALQGLVVSQRDVRFLTQDTPDEAAEPDRSVHEAAPTTDPASLAVAEAVSMPTIARPDLAAIDEATESSGADGEEAAVEAGPAQTVEVEAAEASVTGETDEPGRVAFKEAAVATDPAPHAEAEAVALHIAAGPPAAAAGVTAKASETVAPRRPAAPAETETVKEKTRVPITVIFDRTISKEDLRTKLGADPQDVDEVIRQLESRQGGSLAKLVDGREVYSGASLQKILIGLFGVYPADIAKYIGAQPNLVESYIASQFSRRFSGRLHSPDIWFAVQREFRPDLVEYSPLPSYLTSSSCGFKSRDAMLAFVTACGGDYRAEEDADGRQHYLFSYPAIELLDMQTKSDSVPDARDEDAEHGGWLNRWEITHGAGADLADFDSWIRAWPLAHQPLDSRRVTWMLSRNRDHRVLPHYHSTIVTAFLHDTEARRDARKTRQRKRQFTVDQFF